MPPQLYIAKSGARNPPALPLDAVTRTFGIYGQRGTGKTNTAVVLVEEMVRKGAFACVLDPKGDWWGLTRAGEGGPGLPGIVLGGDEGDVPLEEQSGALVAELVAGRHWPVVVIDLSKLRKGARRRFMADFLEELYERNREALHLVFEEAHQALPQTPRGMDPTLGRVLGAAEDLVVLGRKRGIGVSLVAQRFAQVNATVREQVETLLLHRLSGPLDRKAAKGWIEANGDDAVTQRVLDELPGYQLGDALMYSPGWLGVLERVKIKRRRTFDSSATPEVGAPATSATTQRAPVDLGQLRQLMADTVERAEANDPKKLRDRIAELERELSTETVENGHADLDDVARAVGFEETPGPEALLERVEQLAAAAAAKPERVVVPDLEAVASLRAAAEDLANAELEAQALVDHAADTVRVSLGEVRAGVADAIERVERSVDHVTRLPSNGAAKPELSNHDLLNGGAPPLSRPRPEVRSQEPPEGLSKGAAQLAEGLGRFYPLWLDRGQLALLLQRGKNSSTLTQHLAEAVADGALEKNGTRYRVMQASDGKLSREELIGAYRAALPEGPRALLDVLLTEPIGLERPMLFERAGFSATSSTPVSHLKLLKDNGLVNAERGGLVALGPAIP